jgi:hypothetical protein
MVHMTMPVTYPGWLLPKLVGPFFRTMGATLYWCVIFFVTFLPLIAGAAVIGAMYGNALSNFVVTQQFNSLVAAANEPTDEPAKTKKPDEEEEDPLAAYRGQEPRPLDANVLIVPGVIWVVCCLGFGFAAFYNMRSNGNFAVYFHRELDLITLAKEVTYVAKKADDELDLRRADLTWVRRGVTAVLVAVLLAFLMAATAFAGGAIAAAAAVANYPIIFAIGAALGGLIAIAGRVMCLKVPKESNLQGPIQAAVACDIIGVVGNIALQIPAVAEMVASEPVTLRVIRLMLPIAGFVGYVAFLVFLKQLGAAIRREELSDRAQLCINLVAGFFILFIVLAVGQFGGFYPAVLVLILALGVLVTLLAWIIMYVALLVQMTGALNELAAKRKPAED